MAYKGHLAQGASSEGQHAHILPFGRGESLPPATSWNLGAATRLYILAVTAKDNWKGGKNYVIPDLGLLPYSIW